MEGWKITLENLAIKMNKNFWNDKNVLVTGYEGFLGSNLTKTILPFAAKTVGLDIKIKRKKTIFSRGDYKKIYPIKGNVVNCKLLREIISYHKINIIFHLAAEAIVEKCHQNCLRTFSANIRGTWNILEVAKHSKMIKTVIVASSDKAYGIQSSLPYRENSSLAGCHPYDVSKSCADLLARTYFHTYNLPVCVTRCGNIFGPGDFNFSRIVPEAIKAILCNRTLFIRSDGKFIRDYIYIDDVVSGYIKLAEKLEDANLAGEAFNFSNENPISVLGLIEIIYSIFGKEPKLKIFNRAKYEIKRQYLSAKKARETLDWKPSHSLGVGLKKTIDWYKDYFKK